MQQIGTKGNVRTDPQNHGSRSALKIALTPWGLQGPFPSHPYWIIRHARRASVLPTNLNLQWTRMKGTHQRRVSYNYAGREDALHRILCGSHQEVTQKAPTPCCKIWAQFSVVTSNETHPSCLKHTQVCTWQEASPATSHPTSHSTAP